MKSAGFHEIHMKSTRFHEIWWISGEIQRISCEIHPKPYKSKCFNQNYSVWWMQERGYDPRFHEIRGHSPLHAPPKLKSFCWNIWFYKVLGGFHLKSAGFHECELWKVTRLPLTNVQWHDLSFVRSRIGSHQCCMCSNPPGASRPRSHP